MGILKTLVALFAGKRGSPSTQTTQDEPVVMGWHLSEEEYDQEQMEERIFDALDNARANTKKQVIKFPNSKALSMAQSMKRLCSMHKDIPTQIVEETLICWLESSTSPENVTQKQMDKHDRLLEKWIKQYLEQKTQPDLTTENS